MFRSCLVYVSIPAVLMLSAGCSEKTVYIYNQNASANAVFSTQVLKWYNGHAAAVSINYDDSWGTLPIIDSVADEVISRGLCMDYECVTEKYQRPWLFPLVARMVTEMMPQGVHFFGHGHKHDLHDNFDFEYSYNSFKTNFDLMDEWGLHPRAYGYPGSSGYKRTTQLANQLSGFICARGANLDPDSLYICPDDETEPLNWYYLPSVVAGQRYPVYINDHAEMEPILQTTLERTAWVILMYHSIEMPDGYSYYSWGDFIADADFIAGNDFWSGNMDQVACYIQEKNKFVAHVTEVAAEDTSWMYDVMFSDGLDNNMYDQPLTVEFTFNTDCVVKTVEFNPALNGQTTFTVQDQHLRLNILPNEREYRLKINGE